MNVKNKNPQSKTKQKEPETLFQLIVLIVKGLLKSLPKRLVFMVVIFLASFLIHTYLVIYPNGGFAMGTNATYDKVLGLMGNRVRGTLVWTIGAYLVFSIGRKIIVLGPKKVLPGLIKGPIRTIKSITSSPKEFVQWLTLTAGVLLLISQIFLKNSVLAIMLLTGGITAIILFKHGLSYHVLRLSYKDILRLFKKSGDFKDTYYDGIQLGVVIALSSYLVFESNPFLIYAISFVLIVIFIAVLFFQNRRPAVNILILVITVFAFSMLFKELVMADDGGVEEAGGIIAWIRSEGAWLATALGFPPSFGVLLGSMLGIFVGETSWDQFTTDIGNAWQDWADPAGEMVRDGIDYFGSVYDSIAESLAPYLGAVKDNANTVFSTIKNVADCVKRATVGLPSYAINTANLNLSITDTVFSSQGLGPAVEFTLSYNSANVLSGHMGIGWNYNYESKLIKEKDKILLLKGTSQYLGFKLDKGSEENKELEKNITYPKVYKNIENPFDILTEYESYWTYVELNNDLIYRYNKSKSPISNLISISDKNGNEVVFEYSMDNLIGVIDASKRKLEFVYDAGGKLILMNTSDGRQASYEYNEANFLCKTIDMQGIPCWYEYDSEGYMTKMIVASKKTTTQFTYQRLSWGKCISTVTDGMGNISSYKLLSEEPRTLVQVNPLGLETTYVSQDGLTTKVSFANGLYHERDYTKGLPVKITDENRLAIQLQYNTQGNIIKRLDALGNQYDYKYDSNGNLLEYKVRGKYSHLMKYDEHSNLIYRKYPSGEEESMKYNEKGQLISYISVGEIYHGIEYDDFGNICSFKDAKDHELKYNFGPFGYYMETETDPKGNTVRYKYDNNGRITSVELADGSKRTYTYDCCSLMSVRDEIGRVFKYERDKVSTKTKEIDPEGNIVSYDRDSIGRLKAVKTSGGFFEKYEYGQDGFISKITSPYKDIRAEYKDGHLMSLTDAGLSKTSFSYDEFERLETVVDANEGVLKMEYDSLGNMVKTIDPSGKEVDYEYDLYSRQTSISDKDGLMASVKYNVFGYMGQHTTTDGFVGEFHYGQDGNLRRISDENGLYADFEYDANGNIISIGYMDDFRVNMDYSNRNFLELLSWKESSIEVKYDRSGRVTDFYRSNKIDTNFKLDNSNRVLNIAHTDGFNSLSDIDYIYDDSGNLVEEQGLWPLDSEIEEANTMDSYQYDFANQLLASDVEDYEYDPVGNLISIKGKRKWHFTYDSLKRMSGLKTGTSEYKYGYDAIGNRVFRVENDRETRYLFSPGGLPIMSKTDGIEGIRCYIYSNNFLCGMKDYDGKTYFYHFDQRGNTIALTDEDGIIVATYAYSAFGRVTYGFNSINQPFTFSGMFGVMDEGNGLFFMKTRYYDSIDGRFIQRDVVGFNGGINLYQYVGNNPMNRVDPNGTLGFLALAATGFVGLSVLGAINSAISIYRLGNSDLLRAFNETMAIGNEYISKAAANSQAALGKEKLPYPHLNAGEYIDRFNNQESYIKAFGSDAGKIFNDMGTVLSSFIGGLGPAIAGLKATATAIGNDGIATVENILGGIPNKWGELVTFVSSVKGDVAKWYKNNC